MTRVHEWVERAAALESPSLRLVSGFYRAELAGKPELIEAERRYVSEVLARASDSARAAGVRLLLENHSDFTVDEYERIVHDVGRDRMGVFLDLINPVVTFDDPVRAIERLAPLASSGHVRDFELRSIQQPDNYHRRGFEVLYRYPGEGVAPVAALVASLRRWWATGRMICRSKVSTAARTSTIKSSAFVRRWAISTACLPTPALRRG